MVVPEKLKARVSSALVYSLLGLGTFLMFMPFWWALITAVKVPQETMTYPVIWIPSKVTMAHFAKAWHSNFPMYYRNSTIVAVAVVLANVFTSALAGFIFAKYDFPLKNILFVSVLSTMMVPLAVVLTPSYLLVALYMRMKDTLWGLIVPAVTSPFGIFLMRQYVHGIPDEMLAAARIDGASDFRIFGQIVLPLCTPALSALAIFHLIGIWNDFLWPLIMTDSDRSRTLPVGIALFVFQRWQQYNLVLAASVLVLLPMVIFYLIFQRAFVQGIVLTGMKY